MTNRFQAIAVIAISAIICLAAGPSGAEEGWSLKKINPLGKKVSGQQKSRNPLRLVPSIGSPEMIRPITPAGIKDNLSKVGQGTRAALSRTREALTPKVSWPKLKMPRFRDGEERQPRSVNKPAPKLPSAHSLVSWLLPEKELSPVKKPSGN